MAVKEQVTKVWIEPGCIVCDACENAAPDVFEVLEETCVIRPAALAVDFCKPRTDEIIEAAEECPVDVIKFDVVSEEVADAPAPAADAPAPAAAEPAPAPAAAAPAAPAAPAPAEPAPAAAAKAPAKAPAVSVAGDPDPAIQALLRAATARGGMAGRDAGDGSAEARKWSNKPADDLPPDARTAKVMQATKEKDAGISRRGMLAGSAAAIGWAAFAGTAGISGAAFQRFLMPNVLEEPDPKIRVGSLTQYAGLQPGEVNEDFKPEGVWIIRTDEKLAALNIICTHLGCIPNWLPNDRKFKCPCHGSGFYANGINFEGPAPRPLERFKIAVVDGTVIVDRSKKYQYEKGEWDNPDSFLSV